MSNKQIISTIGIGLAAASVSMLTRKSVQKSWEKITDQPAPKDKPKSDVNLKEALIWAAVSGVSAGVARMAVHYVLEERRNK